jgi:hypothetical protein
MTQLLIQEVALRLRFLGVILRVPLVTDFQIPALVFLTLGAFFPLEETLRLSAGMIGWTGERARTCSRRATGMTCSMAARVWIC